MAAAVRYLLQLFLSCPLTLLVALPLWLLFSKVTGWNGEAPAGVNFVGHLDIICLLIAGPIVGWCAGRLMPKLIGSGRLIWIMPAGLMPAIIMDALASPSRLSDWVEGLGAVLITLPVCSVIGYSLGMIIAHLGTVNPRRTGQLFAASFALFVVLVPILRIYENRSLTPRDTALRHVMGREGIILSPDLSAACRPEYGLQLPMGTAVESLERHICGNGNKAFPVERVRVISGPHAKTEGWVRAWGLQRPD